MGLRRCKRKQAPWEVHCRMEDGRRVAVLVSLFPFFVFVSLILWCSTKKEEESVRRACQGMKGKEDYEQEGADKTASGKLGVRGFAGLRVG